MRKASWFAAAAVLAASLGVGWILLFLQSGVAELPEEADAVLPSYFRCIQSAALADGGKSIVTAAWGVDERKNRTDDAPVEIRRWDAESGRLQASLDITHPSASEAIFSPDGGRLALLDLGGLTIYASDSGKRLVRIEGEQHGAEFSPDRTRLAVFRGFTVEVFDASSGKLLRSIPHLLEVSAASFDAKGDSVLSASARGVFIDAPDAENLADGDVKWTPVAGGEPVELLDPQKPAFAGGVASVALAPDGKRAAVAQSDRVRFFDLLKGGVVGEISPFRDKTADMPYFTPNDRPLVERVAISPDGKLLAMACYYNWGGERQMQHVQIFEIDSEKHVATLRGHRDAIHTLRFSSDGELLLAASSRVEIVEMNEKAARRPDVRLRHAIQGHRFFLQSLAFSPDGRTLASGANEASVKLWDAQTGELKQTLDVNQRIDPQYEVTQVAFLPDGERLILAGGSQTEYGDAWIYDWRRDKLLHRLHGHKEPVESIALSADGSRLVTASYDKKVVIWDLETRRQVQTIDGLETGVTDVTVALSPDASLLITRFHPAKLWALPAGRVVRELSREITGCGYTRDLYSFDFSPDGKSFATGDDNGTISTWDAATGRRIASAHWHLWTVEEVLYSPDGRFLVASGARQVAIFDAALPWRHSLSLGNPLATLPGHNDRVWGLAFTRDGRLLATGDQSGLIQIWEVRRP
jgi:WD40 repeat protein